jgi:xanthine dehydrogenase accessory factor
VVVSTQGQHDEEALENALFSEASYVAFVASKVKTAKILDYLKERGLSSTRLGQLKAPAGLDIHASSPEEIAVSILAEIIQENRSAKEKQKREVELAVDRQEAKDPICGMAVDIGKARHKSEFRGNAFYFCGAGCKLKFDKQPEQYVS